MSPSGGHVRNMWPAQMYIDRVVPDIGTNRWTCQVASKLMAGLDDTLNRVGLVRPVAVRQRVLMRGGRTRD
jgi:hypothetical protein